MKQNQWFDFSSSQVRSPNDLHDLYLCLSGTNFQYRWKLPRQKACTQNQQRNTIQIETIRNLISRDLKFVSSFWALIGVKTPRVRQSEMTLLQNKEVRNSSTSISMYSTPCFLFLSTRQTGTFTGNTSTQVSLASLKSSPALLYVNAAIFHQWRNYSVSTPCNFTPSEDTFVDWQTSLSFSFCCTGIGSLFLIRVNIPGFPTYTTKKQSHRRTTLCKGGLVLKYKIPGQRSIEKYFSILV